MGYNRRKTQMKKLLYAAVLAVFMVGFTSCDDDFSRGFWDGFNYGYTHYSGAPKSEPTAESEELQKATSEEVFNREDTTIILGQEEK